MGKWFATLMAATTLMPVAVQAQEDRRPGPHHADAQAEAPRPPQQAPATPARQGGRPKWHGGGQGAAPGRPDGLAETPGPQPGGRPDWRNEAPGTDRGGPRSGAPGLPGQPRPDGVQPPSAGRPGQPPRNWGGWPGGPGWRGDQDHGGRAGGTWNRQPETRPAPGWQRDRADWNDQARDLGRFADRGNWNRDWRRSDRYDWAGYRAGNRFTFHLPRYYAPGGWDRGYRRFPLGVALAPILFAQEYWIDDPYAYRLPPAYGPYRWVRYYNDALLVDLRGGVVVDVVYDIFW